MPGCFVAASSPSGLLPPRVRGSHGICKFFAAMHREVHQPLGVFWRSRRVGGQQLNGSAAETGPDDAQRGQWRRCHPALSIAAVPAPCHGLFDLIRPMGTFCAIFEICRRSRAAKMKPPVSPVFDHSLSRLGQQGGGGEGGKTQHVTWSTTLDVKTLTPTDCLF